METVGPARRNVAAGHFRGSGRKAAMTEGRNQVPVDCKCPRCEEREVDRLIWQDDEAVRCESCGLVYKPGDKSTCPPAVFAAIGPFSDELIGRDHAVAIARLEFLSPLDAVRLVLAALRRRDAVIGDDEIDDLAEALGVFEGEREGEDDGN